MVCSDSRGIRNRRCECTKSKHLFTRFQKHQQKHFQYSKIEQSSNEIDRSSNGAAVTADVADKYDCVNVANSRKRKKNQFTKLFKQTISLTVKTKRIGSFARAPKYFSLTSATANQRPQRLRQRQLQQQQQKLNLKNHQREQQRKRRQYRQQKRPNLKMLSRTQKLLLGVFILLLVDVIWVSSSELTKFLYEDANFEKPFFCTYFKTSMFTMYLLVIGLLTPWKESCERQNGNYSVMDQSADDENYFSHQPTLSDPTYVPIRNSGSTSGNDSDDSNNPYNKMVRFNKLAEVREMSAHEATEALMARLSYTASMRIRRQKTHHKTAKTALLFSVLWFVANYLFQIALKLGETAMVTLLSSSSSFFTLILAALFPSAAGDRFTITKLIAVIMNIGGVVAVTFADIQNTNFTRGVLLALFSAFFYAAYLVFVKRKSDTEEKVDIPLFFGFVGLWNMVLMWPIFLILNFLKIEQFELPTQNQFIILFLNGLIGTVISEALWLWGCFLTSSLIGTIAMSLQIPLSIMFDVFLKRKPYSPVFYVGALPIFLAMLLVALLMRNDDSDPLMRVFKIIYRKLCRCRKSNIVRINDEEQQESLIGNND